MTAHDRLHPNIIVLIAELFDKRMIKFGDFTLKNKSKSPVYVDFRDLPSFPVVLSLAAKQLLIKFKDEELTGAKLAGLPYAGLPIAVVMGILGDIPVIYPRKETKDYGTRKAIEGRFIQDDEVVAIDDLVTDGGAKMDFIHPLRAAGLVVKHVLVILDREQGGASTLNNHQIKLHSLFTLREAISVGYAHHKITKPQYTTIMEYLGDKE